jgi:excisionase family DNA binding protein
LRAYTVEQVAKMLHISRDKVYYLLRTRQLRIIKISKSRRITDRHLADFVASLEDDALWPQSSARNSSGVMPTAARMPRKVPFAMSWPAWTGTTTVRPSGWRITW